MSWRALTAVVFGIVCISCGPEGYPNSAYGMPQFDDGGDLTGGACLVTDGCAAGDTCCSTLCCSANEVCCMSATGVASCGAPDLVGDSCGSGQPFGP
jgi:hypothetical protein